MAHDRIVVRGAREHNLKNIDVEIPRDRLVVITGISGSGKSTLAFDTIYAEGQRRYVESLSAYARQFLGQMEKPDVDYIEGLSPAISIDQRGVSHNPRSTVGTVTEIYDHLRLLFARIGHPHCPQCGRPIQRQTVEQIVDTLLALQAGTRLMLLAPRVRDRKGEHRQVFEEARRAGFVRVRVNGVVRELGEDITLNKNLKHRIEIVVDRLVVRPAEDGAHPDRGRLADSVETALRLGDGLLIASAAGRAALGEAPPTPDAETRRHGEAESKDGRRVTASPRHRVSAAGEELLFSEHFACPSCGISIGELEPRSFSFNSPHGACSTCTGLGTTRVVDPELVIADPHLSLAQGVIEPWSRGGPGTSYYATLLNALAAEYGFSTRTPWHDLAPEQQRLVLYGSLAPGRGDSRIAPTVDGSDDGQPAPRRPASGETVRLRIRYGDSSAQREVETTFEGVIPNLTRRYRETDSEFVRGEIGRYMATRPCPSCGGARLKPTSLAVRVGERSIAEVTALSVGEARRWFDRLDERLSERERTIARQVLKEIRARLGFLSDVGLDYLTIDRAASTLSGGEAQRIRLATQIGSQLVGVLYILDEPSIGLHQRDNRQLIATLKRLRDLGNTVLVVEHDEETIRSADWVVDIGPGAGEHGGWIVASGPLETVLACPESLTGQYLRGVRQIPLPASRRSGNGAYLELRGVRANNLKELTARFPLGTFICVTGVSGSGKSTLITEVLYRRLAQLFYRAKERPGEHAALVGGEHLDKVIDIDQSPIGRTPRSNPATYTGIFTPIRELFAQVPEARLRGYKPGRFSFNVKGGRCEACEGAGIKQISMQFLPDVYVVCEVCRGKRYNREALEIRYKGRTIADVLEMMVSEARSFFAPVPAVAGKLATLDDVGLGYIRLGQPATTLSGGEAQRVKLASELSRRATGRTLYLLDEPTTGLHFADVERLLQVLERLVESGNTVIVIEHNLDVVKCADWVIDLGPEGGDAGGWLVAEGTPEQVARCPRSYTGRYLGPLLARQAAVGALGRGSR